MGLNEDVERAGLRAAELAEMSDAQRVDRLRAELAEANARIAALETAGKELRACLAAMVDRWEPDTEGLDRVMWENACEALKDDLTEHEDDLTEHHRMRERAEAKVAELEKRLADTDYVWAQSDKAWREAWRDRAGRAEAERDALRKELAERHPPPKDGFINDYD
jgi:chromosome segregation ATPase